MIVCKKHAPDGRCSKEGRCLERRRRQDDERKREQNKLEARTLAAHQQEMKQYNSMVAARDAEIARAAAAAAAAATTTTGPRDSRRMSNVRPSRYNFNDDDDDAMSTRLQLSNNIIVSTLDTFSTKVIAELDKQVRVYFPQEDLRNRVFFWDIRAGFSKYWNIIDFAVIVSKQKRIKDKTSNLIDYMLRYSSKNFKYLDEQLKRFFACAIDERDVIDDNSCRNKEYISDIKAKLALCLELQEYFNRSTNLRRQSSSQGLVDEDVIDDALELHERMFFEYPDRVLYVWLRSANSPLRSYHHRLCTELGSISDFKVLNDRRLIARWLASGLDFFLNRAAGAGAAATATAAGRGSSSTPSAGAEDM